MCFWLWVRKTFQNKWDPSLNTPTSASPLPPATSTRTRRRRNRAWPVLFLSVRDGASVVQGKRGSRRRTMEGAASWHRRLLDAVDIDASEVLDNVLHPLVNVSTSDEAREDAFHDKVIRVCRAGMRKRGHVSAPPREPRGCTRECDSRNTFTKSAACTAPQSERGASTCTVLRGTVVPYP